MNPTNTAVPPGVSRAETPVRKETTCNLQLAITVTLQLANTVTLQLAIYVILQIAIKVTF